MRCQPTNSGRCNRSVYTLYHCQSSDRGAHVSNNNRSQSSLHASS
jgi:hypothetical protein